jgi:hypothetical protein
MGEMRYLVRTGCEYSGDMEGEDQGSECSDSRGVEEDFVRSKLQPPSLRIEPFPSALRRSLSPP